MSVEVKRFSWEEIKKHNKETDAWFVVDGFVHDVTQFITMHPGGADFVLDNLAIDASEKFRDELIHPHSQNAVDLLATYRIGVVDTKALTPEDQQKLKTPEEKALEFGIDLSKGLVWPVSRLGKRYQEFIDYMGVLPHGRLRYFDNPIFEMLTVCPWFMVPLFWIPIACYFFYLSVQNGLPVEALPFLLVTGALNWGLAEWLLHKYVFHMDSVSLLTNMLHFLVHGYHHILPMDNFRLVFPPTFGVLIGYILWAPMPLLLPIHVAYAHFAGLVLGYVFYDCTHYFIHHRSTNLPYLRMMKTHHIYHHYNNHNSNYGISSKLYDILFGTNNSPVASNLAASAKQ
eukprot:TRINITY_DN5085_c0_g1_i1.p1 TRINITY_DN5085_c0_g1~~TRINITY_DN5085_c0_g1_i1.p1  ORF type:complete len:343 (+),score=34.23 TRINITY_DN5085_c0_g1_i1:35-1063(+)